jgi:hypothetical protein
MESSNLRQPTDRERARPISEFQKKCLWWIRNENMDINRLAVNMRSNQLAVYSAMRSLAKRGLVGNIRTRKDQWGVILYFLRSIHEQQP